MTQNLSSLFLLDPAITFLNHGSYGACPIPVFEASQRWQRELERQPVAFLDANGSLPGRLRAVRSALAQELGTQPDSLVGILNATAGLNLVLQSLDLQPDDEILTTDHEYPAMDKTLAYVCRRSGARVVRVTVPLPLVSEDAFTETLLAGMTPRTQVLFLSHITSATALRFPIDRIVKVARARGIITVVDGAHTPGHIPLALDALDADFYAGNCHKWLMAPKGSAFLHVRSAIQGAINPLVISHGWTEDAHLPGARGPFGNTAFIDSLEMQGTRDHSAWLCVPDALEFRRNHQWDKVADHCHCLVQDTARRVQQFTGMPALSAPEFCAPQMVSMPIPHGDPALLHDRLLERYQIEVPCFEWQKRTFVRVSAQGYNTQSDMDHLVGALSQELSPSA